MSNEINIDGVVGNKPGQISAAMVRAVLDQADRTQPLTVRIHSEGGSVFEGFAIYDALRAYDGPKRCVIASSAFSISSFIPMAFDDIEITPNGYLMLHNPYLETVGDDEELANQSELLGNLKTSMIQAYSDRSGKSLDEVAAILKKETYYSASKALANGFVTRISETPVTGRVFAKLDKMPHGVVAALFGAGSSGEESEQTTENPMSESQPVAATIEEIEAAYPKMKPKSILACLKKKMPMASVAQAAVEEMMAENQDLAAKCKAMEDELAKYKAMEVTPDEEEPAAAETEEEPQPSAKKRGLNPVSLPRAGDEGQRRSASPRAMWLDKLSAKKDAGIPNAKAIMQIENEHPGLREEMLQEVNGSR